MWAVLLSGLLLPADPSPEPESKAPRGAPPIIVKARVEKGQLVGLRLLTRYQNMTRTVQVNEGGKVVPRTETVVVPVMTMVRQSWDLGKAKITDGSGARVALPALRERLARGGLVVVSADGKPIDKAFLGLLDPSALVVVAPESTPAAPGPKR